MFSTKVKRYFTGHNKNPPAEREGLVYLTIKFDYLSLRLKPPRSPPRSSRGLATFTTMLRPETSLLCISAIAFSASASLTNVTKPKPFDRPDILSVITIASAISPYGANNSFKESLLRLQGRLPTYNFFLSTYVVTSFHYLISHCKEFLDVSPKIPPFMKLI